MKNQKALYVALAGATAVNALVAVAAVRAASRAGNQRVAGVRETVDRLAQALPPKPTDS